MTKNTHIASAPITLESPAAVNRESCSIKIKIEEKEDAKGSKQNANERARAQIASLRDLVNLVDHEFLRPTYDPSDQLRLSEQDSDDYESLPRPSYSVKFNLPAGESQLRDRYR